MRKAKGERAVEKRPKGRRRLKWAKRGEDGGEYAKGDKMVDNRR